MCSTIRPSSQFYAAVCPKQAAYGEPVHPLYLSVSAIREPSLGEYLWDIENSPLETARPELPIRARSAKISTLRDRLSSANIRKYREHFRYMEVRYGDGTGWLPQK